MSAVRSMPYVSIPLRQRLILDHLLAARADITAHDIARAVGTSVRTIRRDLPEIEHFLRGYHLTLHKKAGTGLRLAGNAQHHERLRHDLPTSPVGQIRPSDRQAWLTCALLAADGPVKLHALAADLEVTITTVSTDLDALESWFATYRLALQRKRGHGVSLEGTEVSRRNAIVDLFFSQFDEAALHALFNEQDPPAPTAADRLLQPAWRLIAPARFPVASRLLREFATETAFALDPAARLEFGLHLALLLERAGSRRFCEASARAAEPAVVNELAGRLAPLFSFALPPAEFSRLAVLLQGHLRPATELDVTPLAQRFLRACDAHLGTPVSADPTLLDGLQAHLARSLQRLRHQLPVRNPLLAQIRESYPALFDAARAAADLVFAEPALPDAEIGFLVLHLGSALERRRHRRWRAIVVCPAGVGTSRMLASRLRTELPEIEIVGVRPAQEAAALDPTDCDLILSTIPLSVPGRRHLVVSPLLLEKDVRAITETLASLDPLPPSAAGERDALARLDRGRRQAAFALELLRRWRVLALDAPARRLADLVPALCAPLVADGTLAGSAAVVTQLAERIGRSPLVLPGSHLAFLHARDLGVARPSLTLHRLARPLRHTDGTEIRQCLLMLAPVKLHRTEVAVLSRLSSLLMEPATLATLAQGSEAESRAYFAHQLDTSSPA